MADSVQLPTFPVCSYFYYDRLLLFVLAMATSVYTLLYNGHQEICVHVAVVAH